MAANVYMRSVVLDDASWVPLADAPTVVDATITVTASSAVVGGATVNVRFREGPQAAWPVGSNIRLEGVDLSELEFQKGSTPVRVLVVGNTRLV